MGYDGNSLLVPCNRGGFNYGRNIHQLTPEMMVGPTRNLSFAENGRRKRPGTAKVNSTAVTSNPKIMGGFDFQRSLDSFQVFLTAAGNLYKDSTTTIKTGMSTVNRPSFSVFGSTLVVCDGNTVPQTWDGTAGATSNVTTPAVDWSGSDQPFQCIVHGRGASRRGWFIKGNAVYYTAEDDINNVTGGGKITVDTGDAFGLTGGIEWQGNFFVFSRRRAFIIDDTSVDTTDWGYQEVAWSRGAAHWRLLVKTENDVLTMADDGTIYSIVGVQTTGDYKAISLNRPAFMDNYIKDKVDLTRIEEFHAIFDPVERAVIFFWVLQGNTTVTEGAYYYIDRDPSEAWIICDNTSYTSGYRAACSFLTRTGVGSYKVYTGDYNGFIWKLGQVNRNDDSNPYYGGWRFPPLNMGNPRAQKHFQRLILAVAALGNWSVQIKVWVDGVAKDGGTISLASGGATLGSFIMGQDVLGGATFLENFMDLKHYGKLLEVEVYNSGLNEDFFVHSALFDYKLLGKLP